MRRNSEWLSTRRQRIEDRLADGLESMLRHLNQFRLRLRRSPEGMVLGVFRGTGESLGYSVVGTRIAGCIVLLMISGGHLLVAACFYLLAAFMMRRPEAGARKLDSIPRLGTTPAFGGASQAAASARVDFVALDRQLDGLNRRIQHMEGVVTDRSFDWDRRMEG